MKKLIYLLLLPLFALGQENSVKTTIYKQPNTSSVTNPSITTATIKKIFFDGLGRPIQERNLKQSNTGKDIVVPIEYDATGLRTKDYLPYINSTSSLNYDTNAVINQTTFYNSPSFSQNGDPNFEATTNAYTEPLYESSPLNRVIKQAAPGNSWVLNSGHEIKLDYQFNIANEVKIYKATATWNATNGLYDISLSQAGTTSYAANKLYKTITKNENWTSGKDNTTEEFRDNEGHLLLKRTYADYTNTNGRISLEVPHDTYYAYDQFGNLTYVIPPLVTNALTQLDGLCYQYKYDSRNRNVEKKLPGKQWQFIVYDKLNRIAATGPAISPFSDITLPGWLITKYDVFNRYVIKGWTNGTVTSAGRKTLQDYYMLAATVANETKIATTTNTTINGIDFRYTNAALPTTNYHILAVNYYDDYNFPNAPTVFGTIEGQSVYYNTTIKPKGLVTGSYVRVPETSLLYKNELSYILYDEKARPISAKIANFLGGYTQIDNKLEPLTGRVNYTLTRQKRLASDAAEIVVKDAFTYTDQDRLLTHTHQINTGTVQLLSKNEYSELGKLIVKRVGGTDITGATPLQKIDYSYNVRGWLTAINNINNLTPGSDPQDLFAFKINYNNIVGTVAGVKPLYNGNISETYWRTSSDNRIRKYGYEYDNLNRLTNATYQKPETAVAIPNSYRESLSYDKNGNITHLVRNGGLDSESNYINALVIDDLTYGYTSNSNQLAKITDATLSPAGFMDDSADGIAANDATDYTYDANGNMTSDQNKKITSITYNHLNLPTKIIFNGDTNTRIEYLYTATGKKVQKTVYMYNPPPGINTPISNTTEYLNGFQYKDAVLKFFPTAEGYVNNTVVSGANTYNYVFNYTDHLGNVRLSYTKPASEAIKIIEENNYYPFGLKHSNYNDEQYNYAKNSQGATSLKQVTLQAAAGGTPVALAYQYKYNGKEYQDELGLNITAMDFRQYDNATGRFNSIDPLAELDLNQSPYSFGRNNPIVFNDPRGLSPEWDDYNTNDEDENPYLDHTTDFLNGDTFFPARFDGGYAPMDGQLDNVDVQGGGARKDREAQEANDGYDGGDGDYRYTIRTEDIRKASEVVKQTSTLMEVAAISLAIVSVVTVQPELLIVALEMHGLAEGTEGVATVVEISADLIDISNGEDKYQEVFDEASEYGINALLGHELDKIDDIDKETKILLDITGSSFKEDFMETIKQ